MHTFALAFGKQASFRPAGGEGAAAECCCGGVTAGDENRLQKKVEEKFGGYKFSSYLCKVFLPHENERPQGLTEAGREIPENIERLTIDKDKKVQELINETGSFARENAGVNS